MDDGEKEGVRKKGEGGPVGHLKLFAMSTRGSLLLFCRFHWVLLGLHHFLLSFPFTDCIAIPFIPPLPPWSWGYGAFEAGVMEERDDYEGERDKAPYGGIHISLFSFMYPKVFKHKAAQCYLDPPSRLVQCVVCVVCVCCPLNDPGNYSQHQRNTFLWSTRKVSVQEILCPRSTKGVTCAKVILGRKDKKIPTILKTNIKQRTKMQLLMAL